MRRIIVLAISAIAVAALAGTAMAARATIHAALAKKPITNGFDRGRTIGYYDSGPMLTRRKVR